MKVLFKKENLKQTISTIIYFIFGVLFCVMPVRMYNFAETVLCGFLLLAGIVCVAIYSLMSHEDKPIKMLLYGVVALVLGVLTLMWPRLFGIILSVIIGFSGVVLVVEFIKNKKKGAMSSVTELVIGIIITLLSIVAIVLSGTNASKNILSLFFGIICLTQASYAILGLVRIVKNSKVEAVEKTQNTKENTEKIDEKSEKIDE